MGEGGEAAPGTEPDGGEGQRPGPEAGSLGRRVEYLFGDVQPLGPRYTLQEVVDGIRDSALAPEGHLGAVPVAAVEAESRAAGVTDGGLAAATEAVSLRHSGAAELEGRSPGTARRSGTDSIWTPRSVGSDRSRRSSTLLRWSSPPSV